MDPLSVMSARAALLKQAMSAGMTAAAIGAPLLLGGAGLGYALNRHRPEAAPEPPQDPLAAALAPKQESVLGRGKQLGQRLRGRVNRMLGRTTSDMGGRFYDRHVPAAEAI